MSLEGEDGFCTLSDEMLLKIFQYCTEERLCRVSSVCKRFLRVANDKLLWKSLYHQIYEYDQPLMLISGNFEFISESEYENPWRESFKQLYKSVHVRPGFNETFGRGNNCNLKNFDTISDALNYVNENPSSDLSSPNFVFVHTGTYNLDDLGNYNAPAIYMENNYPFMDNYDYAIYMVENVMLIGAASGKNVARSVIIKRKTNIIYVDANLHNTYVGYLTLEVTSSDLRYARCLMIKNNSTIDHCIMRSFNNNSAAVSVSGCRANPLVKNCDISNCGYIGLFIRKSAAGTYRDNVISYNTDAGIYIESLGSNAIVRRNNIHHNNRSNLTAGIYIYCGTGCFEDNKIYNNGIGFKISSSCMDLTIRKNKIFSKGKKDYTQSIGVFLSYSSRARLFDNDIYNHSNCGVEIRNNGEPTICNNIIKNNTIGLVYDNSSGLLRKNYIFNSAMDNVKITNDSNPILKQNHIFGGQRGIYILNRSRGILHANVIFENTQMGVLISSESQLTLQKNFIFDNAAAGVQIDKYATAMLKFNKIVYNGSNGLRLASEVPRQQFLKGSKNKICDNNKDKKQRLKKKKSLHLNQ